MRTWMASFNYRMWAIQCWHGILYFVLWYVYIPPHIFVCAWHIVLPFFRKQQQTLSNQSVLLCFQSRLQKVFTSCGWSVVLLACVFVVVCFFLRDQNTVVMMCGYINVVALNTSKKPTTWFELAHFGIIIWKRTESVQTGLDRIRYAVCSNVENIWSTSILFNKRFRDWRPADVKHARLEGLFLISFVCTHKCTE